MRDDLLTRDVERRVAPVLALLDARTWPYAELGTLVGFLRSAPAGEKRLRAATGRLEDAYRNPCPLPELRRRLDELSAALPEPAGEELPPRPGRPSREHALSGAGR